jgi:predicted phosphodiesterase
MVRNIIGTKEVSVIHKGLTMHQSAPVHQNGDIMRRVLTSLFFLFLFIAALPFQGYPAEPTYPISADVKTTRQRTVCPVSIPDAPDLAIADVDQYDALGYSHWHFGGPVDYGKLLPDGSPVGTYNAVEPLLTYFTMSDIHITDKESTAQALYAAVVLGTFGNTNTSAYSPIILSTTHVHDAAVQTINALHKQAPFDFGLSLGDEANSTQYNELRWFIDVMDGKKITPSTGAHKGAGYIDYQKPYQSAGLDKSIPWYAVIGNHDQFWCGSLYPNDYVRSVMVGKTVLNMGNDLTGAPSLDARGNYMGVVDGTTPYGTVIDYGPAFSPMAPPIVAPDPNRRSLSTSTSTTLNWMKEFFNTTSQPKGHGFTQANLDNDFASYTFEPKSSVPVKVIVLDDTCKENPYGGVGSSYARGCLDQKRYDWLKNELDRGQAEGKLMIVAAHIPVGPQLNVPDAIPTPDVPYTTPVTLFLSTCITTTPTIGVPCNHGIGIDTNAPVPPYTVVTDLSLLQTLHNYSNLILWMSGHRHINTVTPQPPLPVKNPDGTTTTPGPEFGFWEVETASLRDHPQTFRTIQILRNDNNTVSIFVTNVDPAVQYTGSPADKSRGYAIGAGRISEGTAGLTDTAPHVYNAELIKPLAAPYTMTVKVTGPGTVNMGPYQAATCTAASPCSAAYLPGTSVTLAATPASGAVFAGWSTCAGTSTCSTIMSDNITVTASFTKASALVATPAYKTFGTVKTGKKATAAFTVKNTAAKGVSRLTVGSVSKGGTDAGQFALVADRCSGQTLAPGKTCTFQVSFAPTSANSKSATISIPSDDSGSPSTIQITGVGK